MGRAPLEIGTYGDIRTFQRGDRWIARAKYRGQDGVTKPYDASGTTSAAAKRELRNRFKDWQSTSDGDITHRSTLAAVMELHLGKVDARAAADAISPNTARLYRSAWRNHLEPAAGQWRLHEVTPQRIERVLGDIADRSPDLAKTSRVLLSAALRLAVRYGAIPHNPIHDTDRTPGARRQDPKALTGEQVADLLVALSMHEKARRWELPDLVLWMLATSERLGNALAASWERIDLAAATADLGPNVIRVKGKGLVIRTADTSTKNKSRIVGLPNTAVRMLRARWAGPVGESGTGLVFPNTRDTGPLDPSNVGHRLEACLGETGFGWVTSHVFRKTVASTLDEARLTPREISDRLGHSRTQITQDLYMRRRFVNPATTAAIEAMLTTPGTVTPLRPDSSAS